jgi:hypothetical protein
MAEISRDDRVQKSAIVHVESSAPLTNHSGSELFLIEGASLRCMVGSNPDRAVRSVSSGSNAPSPRAPRKPGSYRSYAPPLGFIARCLATKAPQPPMGDATRSARRLPRHCPQASAPTLMPVTISESRRLQFSLMCSHMRPIAAACSLRLACSRLRHAFKRAARPPSRELWLDEKSPA